MSSLNIKKWKSNKNIKFLFKILKKKMKKLDLLVVVLEI